VASGTVHESRPAQMMARTSSGRAKVLFWCASLFAAYLVVRLYVVQVAHGAAFAAMARGQQSADIRQPAKRGAIYDRDMTPIVLSLPSQSVYAVPKQIVDLDKTIATLAPLLHVREADLRAALHDRAYAGNVLVARKVSRDLADALHGKDLPGVSVVPEETGVRYAPSGSFASNVVGFTGIDENGLDGLEYSLDSLLRGTSGEMTLEEDEFGRAIPFARPHVIVPPRPGYGVRLTLDSYLQYETQRILDEDVKATHARSGAALVMDPYTGEVLAVASAPSYDVRAYWKYPAEARRDRAVADAYEPGSTFKLITAAAALDSGKVTPETTFSARDAMRIGSATIRNADDGFPAPSSGRETMADIIAYSHNVGAAEVGLAIGKRTLLREIRKFGFGTPTGIELPGENPGIIPDPADWSATTLPTISFGHGIAVTPIALARAYAAIANGGMLVRPRIVGAITENDGRIRYRYGTAIERRVISRRTAAILRGYLRGVVVRGTGNPSAKVDGYTTAGKTGTAQVAGDGGYIPGAYVGSFVGYVPADRPRYVILVKVSRPQGVYYGTVVAAPAFAKIARMAMLHAGVMPDPRLVPARPGATSAP